MVTGERIKELRRILDLNQTDFGNRIGVGQAAIGFYENDQRTITDRTILLICKEYNVNENWLRNGEGEVFISSENLIIEKLAAQYKLDSLEKLLITEFLKLDTKRRAVIKDYLVSIATNLPKQSINQKTSLEEAADIVEEYL